MSSAGGGDEAQDAVRAFAEALRSKGGVEVRSGVLEGTRVDFFRGKDFARWVRADPGRAGALVSGAKAEDEGALVRAAAGALLRRGLVVRCDRLFKKPLPGSKKMVKFPKKLVPADRSEAMSFAEEAFFAYTYERPTSPWLYVWTGLATLGVLAACLFPLAPNVLKIAVFYLSAGLLVLILSLVALRSLVAAATWIVSGSTLWLLPNLLSEELPISELLKPAVSLQPPSSDSKWGSHPLVRGAVAAALGALFWLLYAHSPDSATVARTVLHSRDELFDWLKINPDIRALANTTNTTAAAANATANATVEPPAPGPAPAGVDLDAEEEEEISSEAAEAAAGDEAAAQEAEEAGEGGADEE